MIGNVPGPASAAGLLQRRAASTSAITAATGIPDIVGSLRVDQAWGSAQIAGALHQLRAGYYGNNTTGAGATVARRGQRASSSPERRIRLGRDGGYRHQPAVGRRATSSTLKPRSRKVPARTSAWTAASAAKTTNFSRFNGAQVAPAWAINSVFGNLVSTNGATGQQLTRYFSILSAIEHYWTPALRTNFWAS